MTEELSDSTLEAVINSCANSLGIEQLKKDRAVCRIIFLLTLALVTWFSWHACHNKAVSQCFCFEFCSKSYMSGGRFPPLPPSWYGPEGAGASYNFSITREGCVYQPPTGFGKSIIYSTLPLCLKKLCPLVNTFILTLSPLISLMERWKESMLYWWLCSGYPTFKVADLNWWQFIRHTYGIISWTSWSAV